jgi:hypothetical protein
MQRFLHHDPDTGELRLAFTDLWDGNHERTEYRVVRPDGSPVLRRADRDAIPVHKDSLGRWYIVIRVHSDHRDYFDVEDTPVVATKTPCRRLASKRGRAKCALCPPPSPPAGSAASTIPADDTTGPMG